MLLLKKIDYLAIFFLITALTIYIAILFLPWTIITDPIGITYYMYGYQESGGWPIITLIATMIIYLAGKQGIYIKTKNDMIAIIVVYILFIIVSFYTIYFHLEYYFSTPVLRDLEYSHAIGYYIGVVGVVIQTISTIIAVIILKENIKEKELKKNAPERDKKHMKEGLN